MIIFKMIRIYTIVHLGNSKGCVKHWNIAKIVINNDFDYNDRSFQVYQKHRKVSFDKNGLEILGEYYNEDIHNPEDFFEEGLYKFEDDYYTFTYIEAICEDVISNC